MRNGRIVAEYYKQLLPTYGIFDEGRHFEPGPPGACTLAIAGCKVGFMICEDGWNDDGRAYAVNPFDALHAARPDLVVSINASPSDIGKRAQRHAVFGAACKRVHLPLLFVNQVGGQDQLVFDGASFAISPTDGVQFEAARFVEDFQLLRFADGRFTRTDGAAFPVPDPEGIPAVEFARRQIVLGLRDYARRCGFTKVVVGCSGGIDSALTLALAVEALGADNVVAITMPSDLFQRRFRHRFRGPVRQPGHRPAHASDTRHRGAVRGWLRGEPSTASCRDCRWKTCRRACAARS